MTGAAAQPEQQNDGDALDDPRERLPADYYRANDYPSFDPQKPTHSSETDLTMYWPWVRPCWEPGSAAGEPT